jgi:hypothetical protein
MRVETNSKLVRRNRQIAQYLFFFSFGVLLLGLFVTNQQAASMQANDLLLGGILPSLVVLLAFITTITSVRMTNMWVREPRPEVALREGLKGLSNKSVLYNYYHLPARHVLIAPQGVFVITTRFQEGRFTVNGDKWQTHKSALSRFMTAFRFDSIGNPNRDAERNAEHIKSILQSIAPDVPVQPLIVFTDPRAQIEIINPTLPVLRAQDKIEPSLKEYMREAGKQNRKSLTTEQIRAFEEATVPKAK